MNKMTRVLVMTGMAVVAGATMGAGSASAATATTAASAHSADHWSGHGETVSYYRNPFLCDRAGRFGEQRNRWDNHSCEQVRRGVHRGWWALTVSSGHHGHDQHDQHDQHDHGHDHGHGGHRP